VAYQLLKKEDEDMHREFREEIDTLLVFVRTFVTLSKRALPCAHSQLS
jgi:hypothetical protein